MGTTSMFFSRCHGPQPFPRWSVTYSEIDGSLVYRTFRSRWGCRRFARKFGREPGWMS